MLAVCDIASPVGGVARPGGVTHPGGVVYSKRGLPVYQKHSLKLIIDYILYANAEMSRTRKLVLARKLYTGTIYVQTPTALRSISQ